MIYSKATLGARLGNILFQVAAGASLAHRNGDSFTYLVPTEKLKYVRTFADNILRNVVVSDELPPDAVEYREPQFAYTPIPYRDKLCLEGYFQSEKYFDTDYVRGLFAVTPQIEARLRERFPMLAHPNVCSISVRRGDYFKYPAHHPVCGRRFYLNAIEMMPAESVFIVCSDDIEWCKRTFKGERFSFAEDTSAVDQLYLQSLCRNNITANTSFGWWGAWLNPTEGKRVVYPRCWFGVMYRHYDLSDLIPDSWTAINGHTVPRSRIGAVCAVSYYTLLGLWKKLKKRMK